MQSVTNEQERVRAYLLGQMAQEDLPDFEQRLLLDAAFYEELSIVEDELIDEYLRRDLPTSDRENFESHFMSTPERREKLRFARALKKRVSAFEAVQPDEDSSSQGALEPASEVAEPPPRKRSFFSFLPFQNPIVSYALVAAMLLVVGAISWVAWKNWNPSGPGKVLAIELVPGSMTRDWGDAETRKFTIPSDTETIRLQLNLPQDEYSSYEVVLQDANLRPLLTNRNLKAQSLKGRPAVFVEVPQSSLPPGHYRIKLSGKTDGGVESVASYSFNVLK